MGSNQSRTASISSEVFEYVHPIDPSIPMIGAYQGKSTPSKSSPIELILHKTPFRGDGGNSYHIQTQDSNMIMKPYHNLEIKGYKGTHNRNQMNLIDSTTEDPVAILIRPDTLSMKARYEIYTKDPIEKDQAPSMTYAKKDGTLVNMYRYARMWNKSWGSDIFYIFMGKDDVRDDKSPTPPYTCRRQKNELYMYKDGRQCAFVKHGVHHSLVIKLNAGIDPVFMICLAALLDDKEVSIEFE